MKNILKDNEMKVKTFNGEKSLEKITYTAVKLRLVS